MKVEERLDGLLSSPDLIWLTFTEKDKLVFFSDAHLGTRDKKDGFTQNEGVFLFAFEKYYSDKFTVFSVGDEIELWENSNLNDIKVGHFRVFDLFEKFSKEGRYFDIVGNHDHELEDEIEEAYGIRICGKNFIMVHGMQGERMNDEGWKIGRRLVRSLWAPLNSIGVGNPFENDPELRHIAQRQKLIDWSKSRKQPLICGHIHYAEFAPPYFNCGCVVHPNGFTVLEMEDGYIRLAKWGFDDKRRMYAKIILNELPLKEV